MLSHDIQRLHQTVANWTAGIEPLTLDGLMDLKRSLLFLGLKAAVSELGIDVRYLDAAVAAEQPGSNVKLFPKARIKHALSDGDAR